MKFSLDWHKQGLENAKVNLAIYRARLRELMDATESLERNIAHTERQIAEAERRGMDGFDPDKLLVARPRKVQP